MYKKVKNFLFINSSDKQTVIKNTFWLFFGEIIGRLLKLTIVIFATRQLGVDGWGVFSYALAFISFFFILSDIGVNTFITREMSKDSSNKYRYLFAATIFKMSLMFVFFVISIIISPHIGKIRLGMDMVIVLSLFCLSDGIREFALSINRSFGKMEREAFSKILTNLIITFLGIFLLIENVNPLSLAIAYTAGSIVSSIYVFWSIKNEFKKIDWKISINDFKLIYDFSWPIVILAFFAFIFNLDSIMLGQMKSTTEVGLYSAALRLVQVLTIIPGFIGTSIFPILSKNETNTEKTTKIFEKIMILVFIIGIPIAISGFLLREKIISIIFGQAYISGSLTLGILMFSILASFPNIILSNIIYSKNLQRKFLIPTLIGLIMNITLNIILIPKLGASGAAISTTITQMLIMVINWKKIKNIISFSVIPKLKKIIIANIAISIIIEICLLASIHFILIFIITIISYLLLLLILKENMLHEMILLIRNKKNV